MTSMGDTKPMLVALASGRRWIAKMNMIGRAEQAERPAELVEGRVR